MSLRRPLFVFALFAAAAAPVLRAQGDPMREIQEIARSVDEQLREIDRLLLESGKQNQARSRPKEMLEQASERGAAAEQGIDELIEKLTQMKNQCSGGSSSDSDGQQQPSQGQGQGQQQPQGQPQNRRENQTPEFVQQPQPGQDPQQQPQQPQPDGQPVGAEDSLDPAENRTGRAPPDSETGPAQRASGDEGWGELQPYVNFLKNRGATPKVPEKYRRYWEAYLKNKQGAR